MVEDNRGREEKQHEAGDWNQEMGTSMAARVCKASPHPNLDLEIKLMDMKPKFIISPFGNVNINSSNDNHNSVTATMAMRMITMVVH